MAVIRRNSKATEENKEVVTPKKRIIRKQTVEEPIINEEINEVNEKIEEANEEVINNEVINEETETIEKEDEVEEIIEEELEEDNEEEVEDFINKTINNVVSKTNKEVNKKKPVTKTKTATKENNNSYLMSFQVNKNTVKQEPEINTMGITTRVNYEKMVRDALQDQMNDKRKKLGLEGEIFMSLDDVRDILKVTEGVLQNILESGSGITIAGHRFNRRTYGARIYDNEKVMSTAVLKLPSVKVTMSVEKDGLTIPGKKIDDNTFKGNDGKTYKLDKLNEEYGIEVKSK